MDLLITEVETDAEGIKSSSLRSILQNWPEGKPTPKVLYTVPVSPSQFFVSDVLLRVCL